MSIAIDAKFKIIGFEAARSSDVKKWIKDGWFHMGEDWHKKFRRSHFSQRAYGKYNYTPRNRRYNRLKKRTLGHTLPLVKSGKSRQLSEQKKVFATYKGSRVTMPVRAFNFKPKNSSIDMRKEFTSRTPDEQKELDRRATWRLEESVRKFRKTIEEDF